MYSRSNTSLGAGINGGKRGKMGSKWGDWGNCGQFKGNRGTCHGVLERSLHEHFALPVERTRRLIQKQHFRLLDESPGKGHLLPLSAAQLGSSLPHGGRVALRELADDVMNEGLFARLHDVLVAGGGIGTADVVHNRGLEQDGLLHHEPDLLPPRVKVQLPQGHPVNKHLGKGAGAGVRGRGLQRSGVDPPLCSSRACLHDLQCLSVHSVDSCSVLRWSAVRAPCPP